MLFDRVYYGNNIKDTPNLGALWDYFWILGVVFFLKANNTQLFNRLLTVYGARNTLTNLQTRETVLTLQEAERLRQ